MKLNIKFICTSILMIIVCFTFTLNASYAQSAKDIIQVYTEIIKYYEDYDILDEVYEDFNGLRKDWLRTLETGDIDMYGPTGLTPNADYYKQSLTISFYLGANIEKGLRDKTDEAELEKFKLNEIEHWLAWNSSAKISNTLKQKWQEKINKEGNPTAKNIAQALLDGLSVFEAVDESIKDEHITGEDTSSSAGPSTGILGESTASGDYTADDIIGNANNFIQAGKDQDSKIDSENLKKASDTLYNILLSIGIVIAVAVGMYLGVKFMMSSAEDKAKVKESLIPYIAGCVVIFGAFVIWKLAILLLNGLS